MKVAVVVVAVAVATMMMSSIVVDTTSTSSSSDSANRKRVVIMIGSSGDSCRLRKVRPYRDSQGPIRKFGTLIRGVRSIDRAP